MKKDKHILPQGFQKKRFRKILLQVIEQHPAGLTRSDMVMLTGIASDWLELLLRQLLNEYPCRLSVNENLELVYHLDSKNPKNYLEKKLGNWQRFWLHQTNTPPIWLLRRLHKWLQPERFFLEILILHHIRYNQGKMVVADLIQIAGWSVRQAETEAVQLMANYRGEASVTTEGVVIYTFEEFAQFPLLDEKLLQSLKIWERPEAEVDGFQHLLPSFIREQLYYKKNLSIRAKNMKKFILKAIFYHIQTHINPDKEIKLILDKVKPSQTFPFWWSASSLGPAMYDFWMMLVSTYQKENLFKEMALALEAEIEVDEEGNLLYHFERLEREIKALYNQSR
jgi:hypothetical protein